MVKDLIPAPLLSMVYFHRWVGVILGEREVLSVRANEVGLSFL